MDRRAFEERAQAAFERTPGNIISEQQAISPKVIGLQLMEAPLIGIADARDPLFEQFKDESVISGDVLGPEEWLPGAQSVISCFLPFTNQVKESNTCGPEPSEEWLHARIEGQAFLVSYGQELCRILEDEGFSAMVPVCDERFRLQEPYKSVWSERHVAYACGLGTFGLSKGLITRRGVAGRFISLVTTAKLEPDVRPYDDPFAYCTMCGACAEACPADAIDPAKGIEFGKSHELCQPYTFVWRVSEWSEDKTPRYGCGKCQVGVPCADGIPAK